MAALTPCKQLTARSKGDPGGNCGDEYCAAYDKPTHGVAIAPQQWNGNSSSDDNGDTEPYWNQG
ncbi:hypothetical protein Areg01_12560 [Actinoplanes regularis]|nr:hypothetical protein Areg01_12560 [Actinoplanes regularis]